MVNYIFHCHIFCYIQCISDFDGTLTRGSYKGEKAQSSFGMISSALHNFLNIFLFCNQQNIIWFEIICLLHIVAVVAHSALLPKDVEEKVVTVCLIFSRLVFLYCIYTHGTWLFTMTQEQELRRKYYPIERSRWLLGIIVGH